MSLRRSTRHTSGGDRLSDPGASPQPKRRHSEMAASLPRFILNLEKSMCPFSSSLFACPLPPLRPRGAVPRRHYTYPFRP